MEDLGIIILKVYNKLDLLITLCWREFSVNYSAATVTLVVDVVKVNQNISFNSSPTSNFEYSENLSIPIDASASSSLTLSYNLISGNASLNSNIISVNGTGQIIVELSQIGNNEFNAAPPLNYSVNIGQGTTLLSGFSVPSKYEDDIPFQVTPPTSNRLGEIVYSVQTFKSLQFLELS